MVDLMGTLILELRADAAVAGLVGRKVWGEEKPARVGDDPRPYVLVHQLSVQREKRAPVQKVRVALTCVGKDHEQASAVYNAVSDVLHNSGPRVNGTTGIWRSDEEIGGQPITDPQTHWPAKTAIYEVFAVSQPLA